MKKTLILLFLAFSFHGYAQETKVEQYCEVVATAKLLSNKVTIDVDYGEERSFWKDHRLKDEDGRNKKFNTVIDALNYLGKQGWKLVNAFPVASATNAPMVYHYVFRKEFSKTDVEQ